MTVQPRPPYKNLLGKRLGLDAYGRLASNNSGTAIPITPKAVDATITISAEGATTANTRDITIQLKDANGNNLDEVGYFEIVMYVDATMADFVATGGSTGVQAGASGKLQAVIAKKLFRAISTSAGLWAGSYLDTGTDPGYLAVRLPNGRVIGGALVTNA